LLHSVGENRFSLLAESFQTDDLDVYGYFPTTREFHEVFGYEVENVVSDEEKLAFAKAKSYELPKKKLEVVGGKFDVSHFKYLLTQLGAKLKDEDINEIYILHELYGLNENNMIELAKDVVEMGDDTLDIERFSKHIRKLSATGAVEKRLHSNEEEVKKEEEEVTVQELQKLGATEAEIQMVKDAQELAPMDFLRKIQREQGVSPSNLEDWLLDDAIRKSPLRASVLNILMHYILVQEKIPSLDYKNQFVEGKREFEKRKIVSVVEAMKFIKEEKTSRNTTKRSYTRNRNQGRKIKMPEWWDQKLETDATSEDIQGMLNNMKNNVDDI
jgi:replication initiation and membrane attachment protein